MILFLAYSSIDLEMASSHSSLSGAELLGAKEVLSARCQLLFFAFFLLFFLSAMATDSTTLQQCESQATTWRFLGTNNQWAYKEHMAF